MGTTSPAVSVIIPTFNRIADRRLLEQHLKAHTISAGKRSDLRIHDVGADAFGYAVDALRHRYRALSFCL